MLPVHPGPDRDDASRDGGVGGRCSGPSHALEPCAPRRHGPTVESARVGTLWSARPMIVVRDVSRSFGSHVVLERFSMSAPSGTVVAVRGRNGVGKTTLLRILAGVLVADHGHVTIDGAPPGRGSANFVPAGDRMLNWRLTGEQNLRFFARLRGTPRSSIRDAVVAAALALDAGDLLDQPVGVCSTGQRRRLMLATAVVGPAPVALLDEPYADLDAEGRATVEQLCAARAAAGGVVVYAAPNPDDGPPPHLVVDVRATAAA